MTISLYLNRLEDYGVPWIEDLRRGYSRWRNGTNADFSAIVAASSGKYTRPVPDVESKGRVLFFSPRSWRIHEAWESAMAFALRAAGYSPEFAICHHGMDTCDAYDSDREPGSLCEWCAFHHNDRTKLNGFPVHRYDDELDIEALKKKARELVGNLDLKGCLDFTYEGVALGYLTEMSVVRSCRRSNLESEPQVLRIFRGFLESAILTYHLCSKLFEHKWKLVIVLNGKFFTEAVAMEVARLRGIDVMTYERGFHPDDLVFTVNGYANDFPIADQFRKVAHLELNDEQDAEVDRILAKRRSGKATIINYFPTMNENRSLIVDKLGLREDLPIAIAYPNILWDTAVFRRDTAFSGLWEWLKATIEHYIAHPEQQLVVRVHPAEVRLTMILTKERIGDRIAENFPTLPPNIKVVAATEDVSSYTLMDLSQRILVYSSTMGLEAAAVGREVVTAGMTHYRKLGFSRDAETAKEYSEILSSTPVLFDENVRSAARKYLYFYCYNFSFQCRSVSEPEFGKTVYNVKSVDEWVDFDCDIVRHFRHHLFPLRQGSQFRCPEKLGIDSPRP
ncbi:hypothetical protein GC173_18645 [bacterium]|nr:hypothetical protein [bacterium]